MFITIQIGRHLGIQGRLLRRMAGGLVAVQVGSKVFIGRPVPRMVPRRAA